MADDFSSDLSTTGTVTVGGQTTGNIETGGDQDWFAVSLTAGVEYRIDLLGSDHGSGTLSDPALVDILDSSGTPETVSISDNLGFGQSDSQAYFTPSVTGTYYISAGGSGSDTGTYTVAVTEVSSGSMTVSSDGANASNTDHRHGGDLLTISGDNATVTNDGVVLGGEIDLAPYPSTVVISGDNVSFTNTASGIIDGLGTGVDLSAAVLVRGQGADLTNDGLIRASNLHLIDISGTLNDVDFGVGIAYQAPGDATITNSATGSIIAGSSAIHARAFNWAGNDPEGNYVGGWTDLGVTTVINHGSLISGDDTVRLEAGGTVTNSGGIFSDGSWIIDGSSNVGGIAADAISMFQENSTLGPVTNRYFATIDNQSGGTIQGYRSAAIIFDGTSTITNSGSMIGGDAGLVFYGYTGSASHTPHQIDVSISNSGSIVADGSASNTGFGSVVNVNVGAEASLGNAVVAFLDLDVITIVNSGMITGTNHGIFSLSGVLLTNGAGGVITGDSDTDNVGMAFRGGTLADYAQLDSSGTPILDGGGQPLYWQHATANFSDVIVNEGSIIGDISMGDGNDTYSGATGSLVGTIFGGEGDDSITPGASGEGIDGGAGTDWVFYNTSPSGVTIKLWNGSASGGYAQGDTLSNIENITGSQFADVLLGSGANNILIGRNGADRLSGGGGQDILEGGNGGDLLQGGNGIDTVTYENASAGVTASLLTGTGTAGEANGDTIFDVENLTGSAFDDDLTGEGSPNTLLGNDGNDRLSGEDGTDYLVGGEGDDFIRGGDHADILEGGNGSDTLSYEGTFRGVTVRLWDGYSVKGHARGDVISGFENLYGSDLNDTLVGNYLDNVIFGGGGNDWLKGSGGEDTIEGGTGNDLIVLGADDDLFIFSDGDDKDTIEDFEAGAGSDDVLDLSGVSSVSSFADVLAIADELNGDARLNFSADDVIVLKGVALADLHEDDFYFGPSSIKKLSSADLLPGGAPEEPQTGGDLGGSFPHEDELASFDPFFADDDFML